MFTVTMTPVIEHLAHTYIRCCSASVYDGSIGQNQKDILVATDVPARGVDIKDDSLVLNYNMTKTIQDKRKKDFIKKEMNMI
ncbi:unnamed protein product [Rotaria sordida]|uniref:Helicase C-terminal domain-containing protein n=1 Tax=Rotaria sordida TaxID=392033 RepID=A0A816BHD0_9BILA|nr:unnamed protein product [Rotaria sordida]CAF1609299.1 unnamed protein product [Rotaria sordida]